MHSKGFICLPFLGQIRPAPENWTIVSRRPAHERMSHDLDAQEGDQNQSAVRLLEGAHHGQIVSRVNEICDWYVISAKRVLSDNPAARDTSRYCPGATKTRSLSNNGCSRLCFETPTLRNHVSLPRLLEQLHGAQPHRAISHFPLDASIPASQRHCG